MRKVLILDTSMLCVWLGVPGKETCGPPRDSWDRARVTRLLKKEEREGTTFVLPLASIIETGNHIAQAPRLRYEKAQELGKLMEQAADERSPWAPFTKQAELWSPEALKRLAREWPQKAAESSSLGDATIAAVAALYDSLRFRVEILTGDAGLKAQEPAKPRLVPRRRQAR